MMRFLAIFSSVCLSYIQVSSCFHVGPLRILKSAAHTSNLKRADLSRSSANPLPRDSFPKRQVARYESQLFSLQKLVEEVSNRSPGKEPSTIFVGGKGGVGKTTTASALAVKLASNYEDDLKVLVVSTDPAHSLGDALDEDLKKSRGKPLVMTDSLTGGRLSACEIDSSAALEDFRKSLAAFDINRLADSLGVSPELLDGFGLSEFNGLLNNPPPGLDELVALSNVLDNDSIATKYDVVVVDTAPTGHTLRLLALPQFLDGLLGKLIKLRMKLSGLASTLQSLFGNEQANERAKAIDNAVEKLEAFRAKMARLRSRLQDPAKTSFVVVTIPTKLGVQESKRLMKELNSQGVGVTDIVLNQCIADFEGESLETLEGYYERRKAGQDRWIRKLSETVNEVSETPEYKGNAGENPIGLTEVPFFDVELVGVPALYYLGSQCFTENPNFAHLMANDDADKAKVMICGGKGGVGKTTSSSSLAVSMAAKGHNVALISTDPAHSLGDAVDMDLTGGNLQDCPLIGVPPGEGSLSVLEVDPSKSLSQFKGLVDKLIGGEKSGSEKGAGLRNTLKELGETFDTLPAGTDEVVALAKVINLVKKGDYDRIVIDTAPTGHTLRMLSTPSFLADLIERLLTISEKINSNAAVKMFVASQGYGEDVSEAAANAKSELLRFQLQMYDLEDMFADPYQTEFLIVTVPTELAVRESTRLLNDLTFDEDLPIRVRNVVVNQVLRDDGSDAKTYLSHVHHSQKASISDVKATASSLEKPPVVTLVPFLDTEPRGVYGLSILADELMREEQVLSK